MATYRELTENYIATRSHEDYTALYRKVKPGLQNYVKNIIKDSDIAEDIAVNTLIKMWTKIDQYDPQYQITTWLYRIAYNESLYYIRERNRKTSIDRLRDEYGVEVTSMNNVRALEELIDDAAYKSEMDWYEEIKVNEDLKVTLLPAVHWSKRSLTDMNKSLWGNFLIEYKGKKILFACDTGYGNIYKELGEKYGPIDLTMINIGAYDFKPMFDKSIYHTTPEEALNVAKDLRSKKVMGTHWGTFVLSLEPIMEPPVRFKASAEKYGFKKDDAIIFKIGEINSLKNILSN